MAVVYSFRPAAKTGQVSVTVPAFCMGTIFEDASGVFYEPGEDDQGKFLKMRPAGKKVN